MIPSGLIDEVKQTMRQVIVEENQHHLPVILMFGETKGVIMVLDGEESDFHRTLIDQLRAIQATGYVYLSEIWFADLAGDSPIMQDLQQGKVRVQDLHPDDRRDAAVLIAATKDGRVEAWRAFINDTLDENGDRLEREMEPWEELTGEPSGQIIVRGW